MQSKVWCSLMGVAGHLIGGRHRKPCPGITRWFIYKKKWHHSTYVTKTKKIMYKNKKKQLNC